jgi:ATP-dependent DNA helicase RecG
MQTAATLLESLQDAGERRAIEAKHGLGEATEETICAFANEPDLGGGYIVFGIEEATDGKFHIVGVTDVQKLQHDLTSICSTNFNKPIRPEVEIDTIDGKHVVVAFVPEAEPSAKPVFIKRKGLDKGTYRRIGDGDHRCSEEDLRLLLRLADVIAYEQSPAPDATWDDLDSDAMEHYRRKLLRIEPTSSMAEASHEEILLAVGGGRKDGKRLAPSVAGVLLFGKKLALRRLLPAQYLDYIRVAGTVWVPSSEERYEDAREIREPLLRTFDRAFSETYDSLPRPFRLPPGQTERDDRPRLPERALREVLVNALMHRDYRENRPLQIIRYTDRIEVHNAGYSLTPDDRFGEPGSTLRNPRLAAVFRDVRLAEAKGTGIRAVRQAMREAGMEPPVFVSDRGANLFIATLWLHNLLDDDELAWLRGVGDHGLTDAQKHGLVVARRTGKVNNAALRDLCGLDTLAASRELRVLRDKGLLVLKGKAAGAFYVPSQEVLDAEVRQVPGGQMRQPPVQMRQPPAQMRQPLVEAQETLPDALRRDLEALGKKPSPERVRELIAALCRLSPRTKQELAALLGRTPKHIADRFLRPMVQAGELVLVHSDPNHPAQAYRTVDRPEKDNE